jgi:hypothetical protein
VSEQETRQECFLLQSQPTAREIFLAQDREADESSRDRKSAQVFQTQVADFCRRDRSRGS